MAKATGIDLNFNDSEWKPEGQMVECSRCLKECFPKELKLLTDKDTRGFFPSGVYVCERCHKEVKELAKKMQHEKAGIRTE